MIRVVEPGKASPVGSRPPRRESIITAKPPLLGTYQYTWMMIDVESGVRLLYMTFTMNMG